MCFSTVGLYIVLYKTRTVAILARALLRECPRANAVLSSALLWSCGVQRRAPVGYGAGRLCPPQRGPELALIQLWGHALRGAMPAAQEE